MLCIAASLLFINVVWVAGTYLFYPGYLDHGEPSVTLISWRLLSGFPAFLDFKAPALISNVYGPIAYVVHAISFWLMGPSIIIGKSASILAATLIPIFVFLSQYHRGSPQAAIGAILACGILFLHIPFSIWNRPDVFMALLVVIAVWVANSSEKGRQEWPKAIIISFCAGLAVGMKLHAGVYFAPIVFFHCAHENRGFKTFMVMALIGLALVLLPFSFSTFSLPAFVDWIILHTHKPSVYMFDPKFMRYGALYFTPVLFYLATWKLPKVGFSLPEKIYLWVFLISLVVILYPATKVGAGTHYFFPFMAIFIDQLLRFTGRLRVHKSLAWSLTGSLVIAIVIIGIPVQKRFFRALNWNEVYGIQSEIRNIMRIYKGRSIEMGIGQDIKTYPRTYYRTLLVLAGHPYTIDAAPAMELNKWRFPLPEKTLQGLRKCNTDLWLIPQGERPFIMTGYYNAPVLDPSFSDTFLSNYVKEKSFKFFDVWVCKK